MCFLFGLYCVQEIMNVYLIDSALELFLIKRKIKGPSWLSISKFSSCPSHQRVRFATPYREVITCVYVRLISKRCFWAGELVQIWDSCWLSEGHPGVNFHQEHCRDSSSYRNNNQFENNRQWETKCQWNCFGIHYHM